MRLHVFPHSPNAMKVLATAYEVGLPFEGVLVDLLRGGQRSAAFTALNPNQKMPVLEEDRFVLWESNAIAQYLASREPERRLWPLDARRQADVARWQFWETGHWGPTCGVYVFERVVKRFANLGPANEAAVARAEPDFHKHAAVLNAQLDGGRWIADADFTVADVSIGAWMVYAAQAGFPLDAYPAVTRWYARLVERPAWQKATSSQRSEG